MTTETMTGLFDGLLDDAAVFPPGNLPLPAALTAYDGHRAAPYARLVGPFVLAALDLDALAPLVADREPVSLPLSLTTPLGGAAEAVERVAAIPSVRLAGLEVALADEADPGEVLPSLASASIPPGTTTYVEVPRDDRRPAVIDALAESGHRAKLRTGGVRAELHPDEAELAESVHALVRAGVAFKATAGLHHAVRTTDVATGFLQHGFLNLLAATSAALDGADVDRVADHLADRDPTRVRDAVRRLDPGVRESFCSFGTCSVVEPIEDLVVLGLLPRERVAEGA